MGGMAILNDKGECPPSGSPEGLQPGALSANLTVAGHSANAVASWLPD